MTCIRLLLSAAFTLLVSGCDPGIEQFESKPVLNPEAEVSTSMGVCTSWPCWRGPDSRAVASGVRLPNRWPTGALKPEWEQALGSGWSSPVVEGGRVFVMDRQGNAERLLAFDAVSGRQLWKSTNPVDFEPHAVGRRHGNGPKATPTVQGGRVYSLGIAGWLQCTDARRGTVIWRHSLPAEFARQVPLPGGRTMVNGTENVIVPTGRDQGGAVPLFGYTGSPLLVDDRLIVSVGGQRGGTVMAFDQADGKVIWKSLSENVSYSSPVPAEIQGIRQVVVMTGPRVVGLSLKDGSLLWSHPFQIQYDESISTPAISDDLVLVTGDSRPLTALRIARQGDRLVASVAWENLDLSSYLSSMLVHDGHVFGMADDGRIACVRLSDGRTLWQEGDHGYYCSPILAAGRLVCLNDEGSLLIAQADPSSYRELGCNQVADGQTWTMPAIVGNRLYVRSDGRLACFDLERQH